MSETRTKKLIKNWADGEVKAIDEACEKQIKAAGGSTSTEFCSFFKQLRIEAILRDVRPVY